MQPFYSSAKSWMAKYSSPTTKPISPWRASRPIRLQKLPSLARLQASLPEPCARSQLLRTERGSGDLVPGRAAAAEEPKATRLHEMPEVQLERVAVRLAYLRSRSQCQPTVIAHELEQPLVER